MRWDRLFAELEAEALDLAAADRDVEIADRTRAELGRIRWADRVRAAAGGRVRVWLASGDLVEGEVGRVGGDWLLLDGDRHDVLVPVHGVVGIEGVGPASASAVGAVALTWSAAWRVLARDRAQVRVTRTAGGTVHGVPVRVGADFVELGTQRVEGTAGHGQGSVLVPYAAITAAYVPRQPD
ncbi:MAG: hypothetical protein H0U77_07915 [Nocardioidaceae bacterium]|nr:hypothetical protein [Nocardioidaceae bacterium]